MKPCENDLNEVKVYERGEDIGACVKLGLHSTEDVGDLALGKVLIQEFIRFCLTESKVGIHLKMCYYNIQNMYTYNAKYNSADVDQPFSCHYHCRNKKVQTYHTCVHMS